MALIVLFLFNKFLSQGLLKAQTIAFTTIVILEMARVLIIRREYKLNLFSNKWLILAIMSSITLQLVVIYTPLNKIFETVPLTLIELGYIGAAALAMFVFGAIANYIIRNFTKEMD